MRLLTHGDHHKYVWLPTSRCPSLGMLHVTITKLHNIFHYVSFFQALTSIYLRMPVMNWKYDAAFGSTKHPSWVIPIA